MPDPNDVQGFYFWHSSYLMPSRDPHFLLELSTFKHITQTKFVPMNTKSMLEDIFLNLKDIEGVHSSVAAYVLLTQQPQVRFRAFPTNFQMKNYRFWEG